MTVEDTAYGGAPWIGVLTARGSRQRQPDWNVAVRQSRQASGKSGVVDQILRHHSRRDAVRQRPGPVEHGQRRRLSLVGDRDADG
jgi:hypothetical protein